MPHFELFKHELVHLLLTLLAMGLTLVMLFRRKQKNQRQLVLPIALGAFIGEFLLDTDHLFEYILAFGLRFRFDSFFNGAMFDRLGKTFVLFHSWEWVVVFAVIVYFTKNISIKYFLTALTLGLLFHLIYDVFYNHFSLLGYSLIYRALHDFDPKYLVIPN